MSHRSSSTLKNTIFMIPDPNSPSTSKHNTEDTNPNDMNGNAANTTSFNGNSPNHANSNSPEKSSYSPRMFSPAADGMEIGGGSDEELSTEEQRHGTKRDRSEEETSDDQKPPLRSSEPLNKKRRTQEAVEQAFTPTTSKQAHTREYHNVQLLVRWTCEHLQEMNQGQPFKIGDTFTTNTFAHFRNALEQATKANAPELILKLLETGMQNCVPQTLDDALTIAISADAEDVIALLTQLLTQSVGAFSLVTTSSTSAAITFENNIANSLNPTPIPSSTPEVDWQKKVRTDLSEDELCLVVDALKNKNNNDGLFNFVFGEESVSWPKKNFKFLELFSSKQDINLLLAKCGAVHLGYAPKTGHIIVLSSDFDRAIFLEGLLNLQIQERNAENDPDDENLFLTALMFAAIWGDLEIVQTLLNNGARPTAVNEDNQDALMFAAGAGHLEIVRLLLNYDHDVNAQDEKDWSALAEAAANGHYSVCQLLLRTGARLNMHSHHMPLHMAASNGRAEICRLFVQHGANINHQDENFTTPLHYAAQFGHLLTCKLLLDLGAHIDHCTKYGHMIFDAAITSGRATLVNYLLSLGAKVDGVEIPIEEDESELLLSPLAKAAECNNTKIVNILLNNGAQINRTNHLGLTALSYACRTGALKAAALLLKRGAHPDLDELSEDDDPSMIEIAARSDSTAIVKLLIDSGTRLFSNRNEGAGALACAVKNGNVRMAVLLLKAHGPVGIIRFNHGPGSTLLLTAIRNLKGDQLTNMLMLLLDYKFPLHTTDWEGNDALMLALENEEPEGVRMLLNRGAQIGQINKNGQNALSIAVNKLNLVAQTGASGVGPFVNMLGDLLQIAQNQRNWPALRTYSRSDFGKLGMATRD